MSLTAKDVTARGPLGSPTLTGFLGGWAVTLALCVAFIGLADIRPAAAGSSKTNPRSAAIVVDTATGNVIYEERADSQRYPASLTKLMTLYKLFKALDMGVVTMDDRLPVSAHASAQAPSKLGLRVGDTIRVEDAILALVVQSANDVAVVVGEKLGGTEAKFAREMTEQARAIGMMNTTFVNASGLPNRKQTTTARDLYVLADHLMNDFPQYYGYFATASFKWQGRVYKSHNHLVGKVPGVDGLKTGYIDASGFNIVTSAERDGRRIITVVMGGATSSARDARCKSLIEQKFAELAKQGPVIASAKSRGATKLAANTVVPRAKPGSPEFGAQGTQTNAVEDSEDGAPVSAETIIPNGLPPAQVEAVQASVQDSGPASGMGDFLVSSAYANTAHAGAVQADTTSAVAFTSSHAGKWGIQIGAYVSTETANARLGEAREAVPELLGKATDQVVQVKIDDTPFYRARFAAFTEAQADRACAALTPHGFKCFKVPQGEGTEYQTGGLTPPNAAGSMTR